MHRLPTVTWLLFIFLLPACGGSSGSQDRCEAIPEGMVILPADDGTHDNMFEWWYWTGHLKTEADRWFGFEMVFFQIQQTNFMRMAHHAISDIQNQSFHHVAEMTMAEPVVFADGIDIAQGDLRAIGQGGVDHLFGSVDGFVLDLLLESRKAPVYHHGVGYTDYPFGGNTFYYSRERMDAHGTLTVDGQELVVDGSAWFDHQWGDLEDVTKTSWDWFALQLDDNRELMAFRLRFDNEERLRGGSYTTADCQTTELHTEDVLITALDEWESPHTGCIYPVTWQIETDQLTVTLTAVFPDQEVYESVPIYWEGVALVTGDATGRAFMELNNYCQ